MSLKPSKLGSLKEKIEAEEAERIEKAKKVEKPKKVKVKGRK